MNCCESSGRLKNVRAAPLRSDAGAENVSTCCSCGPAEKELVTVSVTCHSRAARSSGERTCALERLLSGMVVSSGTKSTQLPDRWYRTQYSRFSIFMPVRLAAQLPRFCVLRIASPQGEALLPSC